MRNWQKCFSISICIVSIWMVQQCGNREPSIKRPNPKQELIRFGDQSVTIRDFMLAFQETLSFDSLQLETQTAIPQTIETLGRSLVFERDLAQKARERELDRIESFLKAHETTVNDELYQRVVLQDVLQKIRIRDSDLKRFYEENRDSLYVQPDTNKIVVQGIYVFFTNRSREEAASIIEQARQELDRGTPFETVAQKYSDAEPHLRGKENTLFLGSFDPEIAERLESLQDGEITDIFEYKNRYYLFKRVRFIKPEYLPFEEVRSTILRTLTQEQTQNGVFLLIQELKKKHNLLVNPGWLENPESLGKEAIILSVPGIYELTLGEFQTLARQQSKWTILEQQNFLDYLGGKAVCLAEAKNRGWGENEVAPAVEFWDNRRLAQDYIHWEMDRQVELSEEQIRDYFEQNRSLFRTPIYYDISRLFFRISLSPTTPLYQIQLLLAKAKTQAELAYEAMKNGMSFDEAAIQFAQSEDIQVTTADMKNITLSDLSPQDQNSIAPSEKTALQEGEISEPKEIYNLTKERYGYEIFYIRKMTPSRPMSYEEARKTIGQRVAQGMTKQIRDRMETEFFSKRSPLIQEEGKQEAIEYLCRLIPRPDLQADIAYYASPAL